MKNATMFHDLSEYKSQKFYEDRASFVQYMNIAIDRSLIQTGIILYSTDRLVTLSTCDYAYDNARMVIHARIQ
ncbi:MAG: hypothetical protein ACRDBO_03100 [Lachnospiraceae bacterium]